MLQIESLSTDLPSNGGQRPEKPAPKEKYILKDPAILIGGSAGTGKSSLAEEMAIDLNAEIYDVGEIYRRWDRIFGTKNRLISASTVRGVRLDQRLDENTERRLRRAHRTGNPVIIVSRAGAWIANNLEHQGFPHFPRYLLTVSKDIGAQRVWERDRKKDPNYSKTLEQVKREVAQRNSGDYKALKKAHPKLTGNPMDPGFRDERRKRVYDKPISTDTLPVIEVKKVIYEDLQKRGKLKRAA